MHLAQAAGIEPGDAVTLLKSIKKKKHDKVIAYKERFISGFTEYLIRDENDEETHAKETSEAVWKVIQDSASYLFNASHALAMAYDSLYGAMLKTIAPYELYKTLLKLYTDKKQKEKVSLAIKEMKAYAGIKLTVGQFGQDNRDWYIDKDNHTISQSLASIKYMSPKIAEDLYKISDREFNSFTDVLRTMQMETCLNTRQIAILIKIGYFSKFGRTQKLMSIYNEFFNGKNKLTKAIKSYVKRIALINEFESTLLDSDLPIKERLSAELENTGLCFSTDSQSNGYYFVTEVDDKYGIKIALYNTLYGTYSPYLKMKKNVYDSHKIEEGTLIKITKDDYKEMPKYSFKNGERIKIPNEKELWLSNYEVI